MSIEAKTSRNASIDGGEMALWVRNVILGVSTDVGFAPKSDEKCNSVAPYALLWDWGSLITKLQNRYRGAML